MGVLLAKWWWVGMFGLDCLMVLRGSCVRDRSRTSSTQAGVPLCRSSAMCKVARFLFLMQSVAGS